MEYYRSLPFGLTEQSATWLGQGYRESIHRHCKYITHTIHKNNISYPILALTYQIDTNTFPNINIDYRTGTRETIFRTGKDITYAIKCLSDWEISSTNEDTDDLDHGGRAINIYDHLMMILDTTHDNPAKILLESLHIP